MTQTDDWGNATDAELKSPLAFPSCTNRLVEFYRKCKCCKRCVDNTSWACSALWVYETVGLLFLFFVFVFSLLFDFFSSVVLFSVFVFSFFCLLF